MRNKEFSKLCFYNALIKLSRKQPYNDIGISEICTEAGFNRSTFYRTYKSKEDILKEKISSLMAEYYEYCSNHHMSDHENIRYLFSFYRKNGEAIALLHNAGLDDILGELGLRNFPMNTRYKDNKYAKTFISGGYLAILLKWMEGNMKESDEEMATKVIELFNIFTQP